MMERITQLDVPSGRTYDISDLQLIMLMNKYGFIAQRDEPFTLKSGIKSRVYVMGRNDVTDNPILGWYLGRKIARVIIENSLPTDKPPCLIGIPTAGNAIAAATSLVAFVAGHSASAGPISYRVMRETVKAHGSGTAEWVNGKYDDQHTFWAVDNVITDCGTKIEAKDKLISSGYPALEMPWLIAVDRQQGGIKRMQEHDFKRIVVAYYLLDISYAMGELGEWPKEVAASVEEEIKAHQFI